MTNITETSNALQRGTVACLLAVLCLSCSTSTVEPKMKLEELIQQLNAANPWTVEDVEKVLEKKLVKVDSTKTFTIHTTGPFHYEEGLIIKEVHLRLTIATNEMIRLIVSLSDDASCFTLDRIRNTYPDTQLSLLSIPRGQSLDEETSYWTERPWGHISFGFKERRPDCLSSIVFIPTAWQ